MDCVYGSNASTLAHETFEGKEQLSQVAPEVVETEGSCSKGSFEIACHIFRILADPGVRRLKVEPRKRSVHVFMPSTGSSFEPERDGAGDTFDEHKEKDFGLQASKSTPDLRTTQASTTAGTTWRYAGSENSGVRQDRVSLPPLVQSQNQRPELPNLGGAAAIDAECRRNPASLRAEGSQGTLADHRESSPFTIIMTLLEMRVQPCRGWFDFIWTQALRDLQSVLGSLRDDAKIEAERHALEFALLRKELEICRREAAAQIQALREELRTVLNKFEASSPMGKPHAENSTCNNVESLDEQARKGCEGEPRSLVPCFHIGDPEGAEETEDHGECDEENWSCQEASSPMGKPHAENSTYNNVESLDECPTVLNSNRRLHEWATNKAEEAVLEAERRTAEESAAMDRSGRLDVYRESLLQRLLMEETCPVTRTPCEPSKMDPLAHEFVPGAASHLMTEGHEDGPAAHGPPSKTKAMEEALSSPREEGLQYQDTRFLPSEHLGFLHALACSPAVSACNRSGDDGDTCRVALLLKFKGLGGSFVQVDGPGFVAGALRWGWEPHPDWPWWMTQDAPPESVRKEWEQQYGPSYGLW
eukprot:s3137_g12.t1